LRTRLSIAAAWTLLGLTRLLTLVLPFSAIRRLLGEHRSPRAAEPATPASTSTGPREAGRAQRIGWVVRTAAAHTPWRSDCYPQALAARFLLRAARVPHTVTFGVRRDDAGELKAHAWVAAADVAVTGGNGTAWVGVGTFAWSPRRLARH
jgi:hypothetical protein